MKKIIYIATISLILCLMLNIPILAQKVSFYANITAIEPIMEAFETATGIDGEYTRISTDKFLATVITEFEAGKLQADVIQAPITVLDLLNERGVLSDYISPVAEDYQEWTRKDGIQLFGIEYVGLIYNKEMVDPEEVPKRYEDLTDPIWKDRIVMANPSIHPTTISWLVGLKENVFETEEAWRDFLEGLAANNPMFVASFGPTPAPIESGEKHIGISMPKYIITKAPAPLDWARLEQPLLGTPRAIAVTSSAPNPDEAKAFVDYWLSNEAMSILANEVGEYVLAPGVFPPIEDMDKAEVIAIRELSDEEIQRWGEEFAEIFDVY
ncbi:MAG: extracellular solute-binding protein [Candidatus Caldatribacteriota bacterium]|jgi:iron(III) transport system substrate-binding protein|nr:extracellular solute-binding protein [Atribacterota bacterium]MDD4765363.1 extracellular solute-binding protein [Atribacterota bacterium]